MPVNPKNPNQRRARTPKGKFQADDPSTPDVNEAWADAPPPAESAPPEEAQAVPVAPIRKRAGKPAVKTKVGKATIGKSGKVIGPTFGKVRLRYH